MRLIQISDTHLSPGKAHFADNWAPLARWIAEQRPDLVIHSGDVTVDGAEVEEDLRYCAELMRGLGVRFRAVPGNHDVGDAGSRRIAWFLHRPLFLDGPEEGDTGYWSVKPQPRTALLRSLHRHSVALVASGHLHKAHDFLRDGTRYIWAPSPAFLVGPAKAPPMPGENRLGAVVYEIDGAAITAKIVELPDLSRHWIDDVAEEVYPRRPER